MKINQAFVGVQTLGMDTSPFIYLVEKHPSYLNRILDIFERVKNRKPSGNDFNPYTY